VIAARRQSRYAAARASKQRARHGKTPGQARGSAIAMGKRDTPFDFASARDRVPVLP